MKITGKISQLHQRSVAKGASFVANLWMGIAAVLLTINLFLVLTLWQVAPQLKIISQIVFQDALSSRQGGIAEPFGEGMMDRKQINEMLIRFYLANRYNSFSDFYELIHRWDYGGIIYRMSSPRVFNEFFQQKLEMFQMLEDAADVSLETTSIDIRKMSQLDDRWTIELEVFTMNQQTGAVRSKVYDIVLRAISHPSYAFFHRDLINPTGLKIVEFKETQKKQ